MTTAVWIVVVVAALVFGTVDAFGTVVDPVGTSVVGTSVVGTSVVGAIVVAITRLVVGTDGFAFEPPHASKPTINATANATRGNNAPEARTPATPIIATLQIDSRREPPAAHAR